MKNVFCLIFYSVFFLCAASVVSGDATLISDKPDYEPDTDATLTGSGFVPYRKVTLQVVHIDGTAETGQDHEPWEVNADGDGHFVTTWHVCVDDCVGATLLATAVDDLSPPNYAEVTFTDKKKDDLCGTCTASLKTDNIPSYGTATIDGIESLNEWKPGDLFVHMFNNGDPSKDLTSDAYVKFICDDAGLQATVYVLVKTISPYTILQDATPGANNWIKYCVNGKMDKLVDSSSATDFKYVIAGTQTVGYEARLTFPTENTYDVSFHAEVLKNGTGAGKTSGNVGHPKEGICMTLSCGGGGTAVELLFFKAGAGADNGVTLTWETATETDNAGFYIYRSKSRDGVYKKINDVLIPSQGGVNGASYSYEDMPPGHGTYYYKLEDIDTNGVSTMHGPEKVRMRK